MTLVSTFKMQNQSPKIVEGFLSPEGYTQEVMGGREETETDVLLPSRNSSVKMPKVYIKSKGIHKQT